MNTDAVDATTRFCPVCQAEGRGQYPLRRVEVTGNIHKDSPQGVHEIYNQCPNCLRIYYDTE